MNIIRSASLSLVLGLACLASAFPARADAVRDAVEAGNRAFETAFGKGDSTAIAALYTEDAQVIAPGSPVVKGRPAIAAFWLGSIESGIQGVKLETADVESAGDLAYETGNVRLVAKDGTTSGARYLVVWKRVGEMWLLHRDIWNTP